MNNFTVKHWDTTDGKRIAYPPDHNFQNSSTGVLSVSLADDEEVVWHYTQFSGGRVCSGYTIKKKSDVMDTNKKRA